MNANLLVSNYQLESRMREIRQSGSVGGEPQSNAASLPLLTILFPNPKHPWYLQGKIRSPLFSTEGVAW